MLKILKYNRNNLTNILIGRLPCSNRSIDNKHSRKNHKFFFKPHIDIEPSLNKNTQIIPIKLDDNNNQLKICVWTIKIHNKDDRKRRLRFAKNATDCNCHIDILKDKKSIESGELYIIENLPNFNFDNNEIDIERSITKYSKMLDTYLNDVTDITRDSSKELLFLITVRNSDFYVFI